MAGRSIEQLIASLKAAGELLRSVADAADRMQVSRRILDVAHRLDQARSSTESDSGSAVRGVIDPEADVVPIESLQFDAGADRDADVVPITSLAPDTAAPIPSPMSPPDAPMGSLEASFRTLERLQRERGPAPASLAALIAPAQSEPGAEPVAIESLCYRGRSALERAAAVRRTLTVELASVVDLAAIQPLLQELLDLVPLALDES